MTMKKIISTLLLTFALAVGHMVWAATPVSAGTNLTVSCSNIGSCAISPTGTPLFNEGGWLPGSRITQYIQMSNTSGQNGFAGIEVQNFTETNNVGEVIRIEIHRDSPVGPVIYSAPSLHTFRNDGYFTFDTLNAGQTEQYFVTAEMLTSAGNQYQGSQVGFDLNMGLELQAIAPPQSGGGDGGGGGGGGGSASPPQCSAQAPGSAPVLTITNVGTNTVSLSWTAVSPVTHYALVFTRTSDGSQYGSPNIGNVTSYTVNNLSGGANYTFEVFGVNDCAPGARSTQTTQEEVGGAVLAGRPTGPAGEVLGVEEDATASAETADTGSNPLGQVAGTIAEACSQWRFYLPWVLLLIQFLVILGSEFYFRHDYSWKKHGVTVVVTVASIILFYWLRTCNCYAERSFLSWLCQWYWIVALIDTALVRGISYAFIEDSDAKEWERKLKAATTPSVAPDKTSFTDAMKESSSSASSSNETEVKTEKPESADDTSL